MSTTANALYLPVPGRGLVPLDLDSDTVLLPTFQANDRTDPSTIQSDYTVEVSLPETGHNRRLLLPTPYAKLPAVLTSGGVETLPLATLYVKGYGGGRISVQLSGGNRRFVDALKHLDGSDKLLSDLSWPAYEHNWTPDLIGQYLPYAAWAQNGWGYELYDRGKPLDFTQLDPYLCYPSVAAWLILARIVEMAGFTSNDLRSEPLFAALNVPTANPYAFSSDFTQARSVQAGYFYDNVGGFTTNYYHSQGFADELLIFPYVSQAPYFGPTAATYFAGRYTATTLGYYDIAASVVAFAGCDSLPGQVRIKFMLKVNGKSVYDVHGAELGTDEEDTKGIHRAFTPKLSRYPLKPGDYVELYWRGQELPTAGVGPDSPRWNIGVDGSHTHLPGGTLVLANEVQLTVTLLSDFPQGGRVRLQDWLPEMSQLDFVKAIMLVLGLTIQTDPYAPHLTFTPGDKLLAAVPRARNWSGKLDRARPVGRVPERELLYRFGKYARTNFIKWTEDEQVTAGYGDGLLPVADAALDATAELATLPFAASQPSPTYGRLLRILNFTPNAGSSPVTYSTVTAKPRLTLRRPDGELTGFLLHGAAGTSTGPIIIGGIIVSPGFTIPPASVTGFVTTPSYFASPGLSLSLNDTVLTQYWADVRAMLDEARYLKERLRLTPQDISELDYSVPVYIHELGDFFAVGRVTEFDARRSSEVELYRLNAAHLPLPALPDGTGIEFWSEEFYNLEYY